MIFYKKYKFYQFYQNKLLELDLTGFLKIVIGTFWDFYSLGIIKLISGKDKVSEDVSICI